jgi:L-histidine Nalpha-methyltransferase
MTEVMNETDVTDARRTLFREVVRSLERTPRRLPSKLFYDARGAALFEEITRLDEYYPTRTELSILRGCLPRVAERVGPGARVVEFGTGSGEKTALLLEALDRPAQLVLIDISEAQLREVAQGFEARHPGLPVVPLVADYTLPYRLPRPEPAGTDTRGTKRGPGDAPHPGPTPPPAAPGPTLFFFPGSTLGNFEPHEARGFLANMAQSAGRDAALLLGVDRAKPRSIVEPAYNDARGVTAAFNRNALRHLNRELGGDFDPEAFEHRAPWNPEASRIEMHLVSRVRQEVRLAPELEGSPVPGRDAEAPFHLTLEAGEVIVTEHSYKYTPERLEGLVRSAGWRIAERWTDASTWFDVLYLVR